MQNHPLDLEEIYSIWPTSFFNTWVGYSFLAIIIVFLVVTIFFAIKYAIQKKISYSVKTIRALERLLDSNLQDRNILKQQYEKLTRELKSYFAYIYTINSGITDTELYGYIHKNMPEFGRRMSQLIDNSQQAKFTQNNISAEFFRQDVESAVLLVRDTENKLKN